MAELLEDRTDPTVVGGPIGRETPAEDEGPEARGYQEVVEAFRQ